VPAAMSLHFTSNATFDIGTDLDSPVSLDYYDKAPFAFNGTIGTTTIKYLKK
jgi:arylsulfatase